MNMKVPRSFGANKAQGSSEIPKSSQISPLDVVPKVLSSVPVTPNLQKFERLERYMVALMALVKRAKEKIKGI